jgi:P2-related tail formation protein
VTGLTAGVYSFELKVIDDSSAVDRDTVLISVLPAPNILPTADAGNDLSMTLPANSCLLDGSASFDTDGTITSYRWLKIAGPVAGTIINPSQAATAVSALAEGIYKFELTVTDNNQGIARDTVTVTVHPAPNLRPVARAGQDLTITLPVNSVTLDGRNSSDPDGTLVAFTWSKIAGPAGSTIQNTLTAITTVTSLTLGIYQFELTVTDNNGATGKDTVQVVVLPAPNQPPSANAGPDILIYLPQDTVTLNGKATDPDGVISSFQWRKIAGPANYSLLNTTAAVSVVKNLNAGIYYFEFSALDNQGLVARDTVQVEVKPAEKRLVRLYPNPVTSVLVVEVNATSLSSLTRIVITDSRGIIVYREEMKRDLPTVKKQLDLSGLAAGYYLLFIDEDGKRMDKLKIIVQH